MMKALMRKTKEHLLRQEAPSRHSSLENPAPNNHSPAAHVMADNTSRWIGVQDQPFYMAVVIREARNLTIGDAIQRSTDPSISVTITNKRQPSANGDAIPCDVKDMQARTRICYRNRNPMWEQCLLFPLKCVQADAVVKFSVYNDNVLTSDYMGSFKLSVSELIGQVSGLLEPHEQWSSITNKNLVSSLVSGQKTGGELLYSVTVVDAEGYAVLKREVVQMLEPASLHRKLKGMSLTVDLKALRNVNVQGITSLRDASGAGRFNYEIKIGGCTITRPLPVRVIPDVNPDTAGRYVGSVEIDDKVVIDLSACFNETTSSRTKKQSNEMGDVRINFKYCRETLFRTQIPIWDVPVFANSSTALSQDGTPPLSVPTKPSGPTQGAATGSPCFDKTSAGHRMEKISAGRSSDTPTAGTSTASPFWFKAVPCSSGSSDLVHVLDAKECALLHNISQDAIATVCPLRHDVSGMPGTTCEDDSLPHTVSPASAAPGDDVHGKSYLRLMELHGLSWMSIISQTARGTLPQNLNIMTNLAQRIDTFLQLEVIMKLAETVLVPALVSDGESLSGTGAAMPTIPKPLATPLLEVTLDIGAPAAYDLMMTPGSEFMAAINKAENLTNIEISTFRQDPVTNLQVRTISYTKPLKTGIPMAPKSAKVIETQTVLYNGPGGWGCEIKCITTAPMGDSFFVLAQIIGTAEGENRCRLRTSMQVEFTSSVGFLKGAIIGGSEKDSRRYQAVLFAAYHTHAASLKSGQARAASSSLDLAVIPTTQPLTTATVASAGRGFFRIECCALFFKMLSLLALLLLCWVISTTGIVIGDAIADLADAVRGQAEARDGPSESTASQCPTFPQSA